MPDNLVVATFSDSQRLMHAVNAVQAANYRIYDVYAPYPIHGLDEAMRLRRSRLPWVTFFVGLTGLTLALTFQFYTSVLDWPLNVGGKPDNSTLAFIPISFELTVLLGGLSTVAALFLRARLYPGKKPLLVAEGVKIADTGVGISAGDRKKLLSPFFTTKKNGTGLGLAITYRIIENHRGKIDITSEPGKGTTFTVQIPIL